MAGGVAIAKELRTGGASFVSTRSVTASITLDTLGTIDEAVKFTGGAGQIITLPLGTEGRRLFIKNRGSAVLIKCSGSDTIDGINGQTTGKSLGAGSGWTLIYVGGDWVTI